jgi:Na+-translocating ferredoxin:NAD+ oxidoreductase subunit G
MLIATLLMAACQATTTEATPADAKAASATAPVTPKEALALAFPKCKIERVVHYPDKKQKASAGKLVGTKVSTKTVRAYRATKEGKLVGTGYFDSHKIRTKAQTLFVVVAPDHTIARVEVLRFDEPPEYKPKAKWFAKFKGQKLDKKLQIKQNIPRLTGATLSARATTTAVRRVLAWHQIFYPAPPKASKKTDGDDLNPKR